MDLLRRSSRGVTLTAEGKLFLEEVRELLKHADESVERVRALARGEYGELHIGYAPVPTTEILPPALAAFQRAVPMSSSPDYEKARWKSQLRSSPPASKTPASSLNYCAPTHW